MLLAIESSCDETAVAIITREEGQPRLLASLISSQIDIHRAYGGVVPEVASRNHALNLPPLVAQALEQAGIKLEQIEAFAATRGPGLASSLLVGFSYAKALSTATGKPFCGVNHMEGHLLSPFLSRDENSPAKNQKTTTEIPPHLSLIVSGGHTLLIDVQSHGKYKLLGRTRDDAAGEAFDKVGRLLDLPYPGGPEIEKAAHHGNPEAYQFPRVFLKEAHHDFSFSGLKTAVRYTLEKIPDPTLQLADLSASFQEAICDVLVRKTLRAAQQSQHNLIALSGGVACNKALQQAFQNACQKENHQLLVAPPSLTTDNAAMIAFAGLLAHENKQHDSLQLSIEPSLPLAT
nr:tRNA N6-adenosine threonylcarbamoyltransferase-like [Nerophis lumbriciformis]